MKKIVLMFTLTSACLCFNMSFADQSTSIPSPNMASPTSTQGKTPPAQTALSGNFDITTNYMFRGISNSNNLPAFQGGLTYTFLKSGIYLNIWGSNIDQPDSQGNTGTLEIDTIAGIANDIGDHFHYDINIDRYNYPKSSLSYNEFIANAQFYFLTAQLGYSTNVYNSHGNGTYYNIGATSPIPPKYIFKLNDVTISGGLGHYSLPRNLGLYSYNDYNILLAKDIGIYNIAIQWTDTAGNTHAGPLGGNKIIGTLTANF